MAASNQQRFSTVVGTGGSTTGSSVVHACKDIVLLQGPPERLWEPALPAANISNVLPSGLG